MIQLDLQQLLEWFESNTKEALQLIHNDKLLSKREVDGLFIANASKELHSPTEIHQQLAKGIVYTASFELVALPLSKIWNAHEMQQDQAAIVNDLWADPEYAALVYILEKVDGTMLSRFIHKDKVYLATRGVLLGDEYDEDYVQQAVKIAQEKYPRLLDPTYCVDRTLVFELVFPEGRILTDYGDKRDLILTGCFHNIKFYYCGYDELVVIASYMDLNLVPRFVSEGNGPWEQMGNMLETIKGTDAEGFMMTIEVQSRVVCRMKFKGDDYIRLLRLMNYCTYKHVVEMILADKSLLSMDSFATMLAENAGDDLPQYVLDEYMVLHKQYTDFSSKVYHFCQAVKSDFNGHVKDMIIPLGREDKKDFAQLVKNCPERAILFRYADGKSVEQISQEICQDARQDLNYLEKYGVMTSG